LPNHIEIFFCHRLQLGQFVPGVSPSAAGKIAGIEQAGLPVGKGSFSEMDLLTVTIG